MSAKFFTRRFFLDSPIDRYTNKGGSHYIGPFTSFWVSNAKKSGFKASIVINPREDRAEGLPLRLNQCQSIEGKADEACIEFDLAQPNDWIDITFSQDDKISVGSVVVETKGSTAIVEGSSYLSSKVTVTAVTSEIVPSNDARLKASLQHKSGGSIWIGNPSELANADYKNICHEIKAGDILELRNSGSLSAKSDAGSVIFSLIQELA